VRVVRDNKRTGIVEFIGTVDSIVQTGVVVILDNDPAIMFRVTPFDTFEPLKRPIVRRFFGFNDIEKIPPG